MKTKPKKPTMNELKTAMNNMIKQLANLHYYLKSVDTALASYIEFKNDKHKYNEWLKEQIKKQEKGKKDERRDTKDGRRAETHQESGV